MQNKLKYLLYYKRPKGPKQSLSQTNWAHSPLFGSSEDYMTWAKKLMILWVYHPIYGLLEEYAATRVGCGGENRSHHWV